ncbi:MAG: hypothetical protein IJY65_05820 [Clostridia bacterium]|nr:hypothetical protein [Clostridia bacterium]
MKKVSLLVLVIMVLALCLTACGHEHEFSDTWSKDDNGHWHAATCEHSEVTADSADHVDLDNNKICDVCEYDYNHTHTYQAADAWTYNAAEHWHAATCGCTIAPKDVAKHADTDNDGFCDVCAHVAGHDHVYSESFTTSETHHWHESLCGHSVISGKYEHDFDLANVCKDCGYAKELDVNALDFDTALKLGLYRNEYADYGTSDEQNVLADYGYDVYFEVEPGFVYYTLESNYGTETYYYYLTEDNQVWALVDFGYGNGIELNPNEYSVSNTKGYYFDGSFVNGAAIGYGVADYVQNLYTFALNAPIPATDASYVDDDGNKVYSFTFAHSRVWYLYEYTVEFTLDPELYYINKLTIDVEGYDVFDENGEVTTDALTVEWLKDDQGNLILDDDNDRTLVGYEWVGDKVAAGYVWTTEFEQFDGNPNDIYGPDRLAVESFEVYYELNGEMVKVDENTVISTPVSTGDDVSINLYVKNINPVFDGLFIDKIALYSTEGDYWDAYWETLATVSEYEDGFVINIRLQNSGTQVYLVSSTLYSVEVAFDAIPPELTSFDSTVTLPDDYSATVTDNAEIYENEALIIGVQVNNKADASFVAELTSDNKVDATLLYTDIVGGYVFTSAVPGTYTVKLTSSADATFTATVTVTVKADYRYAEELLNGEYVAGTDTPIESVVFAPDATGLAGTVTVNLRNGNTATASYTFDNHTVTVDSTDFSVKIVDKASVVITASGSDIALSRDFAKIFNGSFTSEAPYTIPSVVFTPTSKGALNGTVTVNYYHWGESYSAVYAYSVVDGEFVLGALVSGVDCSAVFTVEGTTISIATDDTWGYAYVLTQETPNEEKAAAALNGTYLYESSDLSEIFNDTYEISYGENNYYSVTFVANTTDPTTGTVTVAGLMYSGTAVNDSFTYSLANGVFTTSLTSGEGVSAVTVENGMLKLMVPADYTNAELTSIVLPIAVDSVVVTPTEEGALTGSLSVNVGENSSVYAYEWYLGVVYLAHTSGDDILTGVNVVTSTTVEFTINGVVYSFDLEVEEGSGSNTGSSDIAALLNGTHVYNGDKTVNHIVNAIFTPDSEGALTGTVVFNALMPDMGDYECSGTYDYAYDAGEIVLTKVESEIADPTVTIVNGKLVVTNNYGTFTLDKAVSYDGSFTATAINGSHGGTYNYVIGSDNSVTVYLGGEVTDKFVITYTGTFYTIIAKDMAAGSETIIGITLEGEHTLKVGTIGMYTVVFGAAGGEEEVSLTETLESVYSWNSASLNEGYSTYAISFYGAESSVYDSTAGTYGDYYDFSYTVDDETGAITFTWSEDVSATKWNGATAVYADGKITVTYGDGTTEVYTAQ